MRTHVIAAAVLAVGLSIGGGGLAAFADDAPGGTPPTDPTPTAAQTDTPAAPVVADPPAADPPVTPAVAPQAKTVTVDPPAATKDKHWVLPNGGTADNVTWPQAVYDPAAPLVCGTPPFTVQDDINRYSTPADIASVDAQGADGVLTQGEDYGTIISWSFHVVTPPACAPIVCTSTGSYHESDDNAGVVTDAGIDIRSLGDGKATDYGYTATGNAQGFTTLDWTATDVVGNGIFARIGFDLSADGGPAYASFSGLPTHVDQTTVAGYGSKAVFSGKSIADVGATWPHNKILFVIWQTGSSYPAKEGGLLTSVTSPCITASFIKPPVVATTTTTTNTTPTADTSSLASTGPGPITTLLALVASTLLYLGASLRFKALQRPLRWAAAKLGWVAASA